MLYNESNLFVWSNSNHINELDCISESKQLKKKSNRQILRDEIRSKRADFIASYHYTCCRCGGVFDLSCLRIHHINKLKCGNNPSNLSVVCGQCHWFLHQDLGIELF